MQISGKTRGKWTFKKQWDFQSPTISPKEIKKFQIYARVNENTPLQKLSSSLKPNKIEEIVAIYHEDHAFMPRR